MTLPEKLDQLSLATMSRQLETTLSEAATRNLSVAATLEWLADMELEARNRRAIERRFKCSRLQTQPSIDGFHFQHHKSRLQNKNRILRLLDLEFLHKGTNLVFIGNPGVGKTFLSKIIGWRICQANQRILFTTAMDMLNHLLASQVDHSLVRKLKTYTEPTALVVDELGYLALDQQTSNLNSGPQLLQRTQRSPTGVTSSSTRPSPPPSPTGSWRTPKSSCWAAIACASPRIRIHRPSSCGPAPSKRRAVR
jgi:DNA replication protein DnaC